MGMIGVMAEYDPEYRQWVEKKLAKNGKIINGKLGFDSENVTNKKNKSFEFIYLV